MGVTAFWFKPKPQGETENWYAASSGVQQTGFGSKVAPIWICSELAGTQGARVKDQPVNGDCTVQSLDHMYLLQALMKFSKYFLQKKRMCLGNAFIRKGSMKNQEENNSLQKGDPLLHLFPRRGSNPGPVEGHWPRGKRFFCLTLINHQLFGQSLCFFLPDVVRPWGCLLSIWQERAEASPPPWGFGLCIQCRHDHTDVRGLCFQCLQLLLNFIDMKLQNDQVLSSCLTCPLLSR